MKIRSGFVSNSSSTSYAFAFIYRDATIDEIDDDHVHILAQGDEGPVYFRPTDPMRRIVRENPSVLDAISLVYTYIEVSEDVERRITVRDLTELLENIDRGIVLKGKTIINGEPEDEDEFRSMFLNGD